VKTRLVVRGTPRRILPATEEHLLRIGQEAMTNTLRHAHARRMEIELAFGKKSVRLTAKDDGRGFSVSRKPEGLGLRGIKERVEALGGRLRLRSGRAIGTHLSVSVGLDAAR
jgi:two-component system NarL family sensor kinase